MKTKTEQFWTYLGFKEISCNYMICPMCDLKQRIKCDEDKKCYVDLTFFEEKKIAKLDPHREPTKMESLKIELAIDLWRREQYTKCKKTTCEITQEDEHDKTN